MSGEYTVNGRVADWLKKEFPKSETDESATDVLQKIIEMTPKEGYLNFLRLRPYMKSHLLSSQNVKIKIKSADLNKRIQKTAREVGASADELVDSLLVVMSAGQSEGRGLVYKERSRGVDFDYTRFGELRFTSLSGRDLKLDQYGVKEFVRQFVEDDPVNFVEHMNIAYSRLYGKIKPQIFYEKFLKQTKEIRQELIRDPANGTLVKKLFTLTDEYLHKNEMPEKHL